MNRSSKEAERDETSKIGYSAVDDTEQVDDDVYDIQQSLNGAAIKDKNLDTPDKHNPSQTQVDGTKGLVQL